MFQTQNKNSKVDLSKKYILKLSFYHIDWFTMEHLVMIFLCLSMCIFFSSFTVSPDLHPFEVLYNK